MLHFLQLLFNISFIQYVYILYIHDARFKSPPVSVGTQETKLYRIELIQLEIPLFTENKYHYSMKGNTIKTISTRKADNNI